MKVVPESAPRAQVLEYARARLEDMQQGDLPSHAVEAQADLLAHLEEVPGATAWGMRSAALAASARQHTRGIWTIRACRVGLVLSGVTAVLGGLAGEQGFAFAATGGLFVGSMGGAVGERCAESAQSLSRLAITIGEIDAVVRGKEAVAHALA